MGDSAGAFAYDAADFSGTDQMPLFENPYRNLQLDRFPAGQKDGLQPWDAGDAYLLNYVHESQLLHDGARPLIFNDQNGALSLALSDFSPLVVVDSACSMEAIRLNAEGNGLTVPEINNTLAISAVESHALLFKVPRSIAYFKDALPTLIGRLLRQRPVVGAAMTRYLSYGYVEVMEQLIGKTVQSLAWKKARLLLSRLNDIREQPGCDNTLPGYFCEELDGSLTALPGVFSSDRLDQGARVMLEVIPRGDHFRDICDLACGNGVLGIRAAQLNPQARLLFTDDSHRAVVSCERNYQSIIADDRATFSHADALSGVTPNSMDLILCNPPFHQQNAVTTAVAERMFRQAHKVLRQGGELLVVANRHLGYHQMMKRIFGGYRHLTSTNKFVVLSSRRR